MTPSAHNTAADTPTAAPINPAAPTDADAAPWNDFDIIVVGAGHAGC